MDKNISISGRYYNTSFEVYVVLEQSCDVNTISWKYQYLSSGVLDIRDPFNKSVVSTEEITNLRPDQIISRFHIMDAVVSPL